MKIKIVVVFIILATRINANVRFVRVVFNGNAATEATIIWDQVEGEFNGFYMDTVDPSANRFVNRYPLSSSNKMHQNASLLTECQPKSPATNILTPNY